MEHNGTGKISGAPFLRVPTGSEQSIELPRGCQLTPGNDNDY